MMFNIYTRKYLIWIAASAAFTFLCCPVHADDTKKAKEAYMQGQKLSEEGRHAEAADAFREANRLRPSYRILYMLGLSEASAGRNQAALEAYEAYLAEGGDKISSERRKWVDGEIERLKKAVDAEKVSEDHPASDAESLRLAKRAYQSGMMAYEEGRYVEASEHFREANRIKSSWKLWLNIGQAEAAADRYGLAIEAFGTYLTIGAEKVSAENRTYVENEIARLKKMIGYVEVSAPDGARISIDGISRGMAPLPSPIPVAAGTRHQLAVSYEDVFILDRIIRVSAGLTVQMSARKRTEIAQPQEIPELMEEETEDEEPEEGMSDLELAGWITLGSGAAILAGGAVTGALALMKQGELEDKCPEKQCDDSESLSLKDDTEQMALITDILIPVGGAIAATGAVLLIIDAVSGESENESVSLTPFTAAGSAGLSIEGKF